MSVPSSGGDIQTNLLKFCSNQTDYGMNGDKGEMRKRQEVRIVVLKEKEKEKKLSPFRQFCSQTTLHGWSYLGNPQLPLYRRLLWSLMITVAVVTACYFIHWFVNGFHEYDVSTTIETTTASLSKVHFPAVTICNDNQIRRSFLSDLDIYGDQELSWLFAKEFVIGRQEEMDAKDKARVDAVLERAEFRQMVDSYLLDALQVNATNLDFMMRNNLLVNSQLVSRLAVQWQPGLMIPYASFNGTDHKGSIPTFVGTDHGICAKVFPQTFDIADEAPERAESARRKLEAETGVKNGINNGMLFVLDAEVYDYVDNRSASGGFKLALHHHLDMAVIRQLGFNVAPGTETHVAVTPVLHTTTRTAQTRFTPEERNCYFQSEIQLQHWVYEEVISLDPTKRSTGGRYSMSNCLLEAALQAIPERCGCSPSFHLLGYNASRYPICMGRGIHCIGSVLDQIGIMDSVMDRGSVKKCRAACVDQSNHFQLSTLQYPSGITYQMRVEVCQLAASLAQRCGQRAKRVILDEIYPELCAVIGKLNGTDPCGTKGILYLMDIPGFRESKSARSTLVNQLYLYARDNIALVRIFIKEPFVTKLKRDEAFSIILFVAGAGGLMGLCTGFSFLSGVEVIYHLFFGICDSLHKLWEGRKVKNEANRRRRRKKKNASDDPRTEKY